ncbi:hypothetical protein [Paracerasibacillus soli]|uniref:Uncharacterized protein n=1 Tax=Paracerasibacillus soli TaxID=480284 RepID=A0ABU5CSI6_9BACI|nr:hypothetical protein [Virgibacillus soli]MDY0408836.1 hypothetical protein [Virgibacillus soli]
MAKKVLVFADFGMDDMIAFMYSHLNEANDVVGVVADYGNNQ